MCHAHTCPSVGGTHMCHKQPPGDAQTMRHDDFIMCVCARVSGEDGPRPILIHFSMFLPLRCQQPEGQKQQDSHAQQSHNPGTCIFQCVLASFSADYMRCPFPNFSPCGFSASWLPLSRIRVDRKFSLFWLSISWFCLPAGGRREPTINMKSVGGISLSVVRLFMWIIPIQIFSVRSSFLV